MHDEAVTLISALGCVYQASQSRSARLGSLSRSLWAGSQNDLIGARDSGLGDAWSVLAWSALALYHNTVSPQGIHTRRFQAHQWDVANPHQPQPLVLSPWVLFHLTGFVLRCKSNTIIASPLFSPVFHLSHHCLLLFLSLSSPGWTVCLQAIWLLLGQWNVPAFPGLLWVRLHFMVLWWATKILHFLNDLT